MIAGCCNPCQSQQWLVRKSIDYSPEFQPFVSELFPLKLSLWLITDARAWALACEEQVKMQEQDCRRLPLAMLEVFNFVRGDCTRVTPVRHELVPLLVASHALQPDQRSLLAARNTHLQQQATLCLQRCPQQHHQPYTSRFVMQRRAQHVGGMAGKSSCVAVCKL